MYLCVHMCMQSIYGNFLSVLYLHVHIHVYVFLLCISIFTVNTCECSVIGASLSEPHIDHDNGPCARNNGMYLCIMGSR